MTPEQEKLLLERLREGRPEAFDYVLRRYQDKIYNFVYRILGDPQEAEDVAQDVFVSFYVTIHSFRGQCRLSTWLHRIALNQARNRLKYLGIRRAHRHEPRAEDTRPIGGSARPGYHAHIPRPDELAEGHELEQRIQEALDSLDPEQRSLIVCRDIQGMTYQEICEIFDLPLGTVKSKLHRARLALKERLAPYIE